MKRRSLTLVLCLLATLSLASVGFAAWVISAGDIENLTGNITVESVTDNSVIVKDIKYDGAATTEGFVFGKPVSPKVAETWLGNDKTDKLSIVVTFTVVKKAKDTEVVKDAVCSVAFSVDPTSEYIEVVNANPTVTNNGDGTYSFTLELAWADNWGEGENPFDYYNAKTSTDFVNGVSGDTWADDAKTQLEAMYAALGEAEFEAVLTVNPKK